MSNVSKPTASQPTTTSSNNHNLPCQPATQGDTIVVIHADSVNGLGDNVIILDALLAMKRIYRASLVVFARDVLQELLKGLDFVDEFCLLEGNLTAAINRERINAYQPRYLLSLSCKAWQLRFFASTNARTIITRAKLANILRPRFSPVMLLDSSSTHREMFLLLARKIDKARFDSKIDSIDFADSRVKASDKDSVIAFLAQSLKRFSRDDFNHNANLQAKIAFTKAHRAHTPSSQTLSPLALSLSSSQTPLFLVCVNPFSIMASHTLHLESYLTLIDKIAALPNCIPCICTYGKTHALLEKALQDYNSTHSCTLQDRCIIYHNQGDLHNLAAFLESMSCIITPSTGALHLAENLFTPSIALVSLKDTKRWGSQDKRYCIIKEPLAHITKSQESAIIESTFAMLQSLLPQSLLPR